MQLLFAEEGAVYNLQGTPDKATITKLPWFNTEQSINVPDDWISFNFPTVITEKIYYYCFIFSLKDRNYESAYYYATHISSWLASKVFYNWFADDGEDLNFKSPHDIRLIYSEIRSNITFASLVFDVCTERSNPYHVYPCVLQFVSRFRKRTAPIPLSRIPPPSAFITGDIVYNQNELDQEPHFGNPIDGLDPFDFIGLHNVEESMFTNLNLDSFTKGPHVGDYCLIDAEYVAAGIVKATKMYHPCVFIELFDCNDDEWVTLENYNSLRKSNAWKKFEAFLQYTISPSLHLLFRVADTSTFISLK
jgi:hypothetical protein